MSSYIFAPMLELDRTGTILKPVVRPPKKGEWFYMPVGDRWGPILAIDDYPEGVRPIVEGGELKTADFRYPIYQRLDTSEFAVVKKSELAELVRVADSMEHWLSTGGPVTNSDRFCVNELVKDARAVLAPFQAKEQAK